MKAEEPEQDLEMGIDDEKQVESDVEVIRRQQGHTPLDPHLDKRLDRKFDLHIIPWIFGIWLLAFIDRSNIGNAKIDGLTEDLDMETGTKFNVALLVFFIPYIVVDVPCNWIVKHVKAGIFLPTLITLWGLVCTFVGFTKSYGGLVAGRFFLGMFEGGLLGGILTPDGLSYWYVLLRGSFIGRLWWFTCVGPGKN
ncbi:Major Facilitator Superfamily [Aspergillus sclerotialis]|uniref:Major Facilitator Superfamily n=1 Tax=Aspergillus sclerotialis TaxID=2070753 RepID=A0A3A2ZGT5_9EURO|nr:Major Facilitator Superfamily [Aspergillus sclerotialis]